MRRNLPLAAIVLLVSMALLNGQATQAQEKSTAKADTIKLLDGKKVVEYLGISKAMKDSVLAKIAQIQKVVDEDKNARAEMRAKFFSGGDRPSMETMQELRAQAGERQKKIDTLVQDIQSKFTEKQKEKFKTVMTPNLQEMARAERGQFRGRGERREQ